MTRTTAYKAIYFSAVAAGILLVVATTLNARNGNTAWAIAGVAIFAVLLLPGRILAYYWSELLAGLRYLNQGDYERSKTHSKRFLTQVHERPWLKKLIWLGTSSYSRDPEVLALNNLGAAELALEEIDIAEAHFARAIALDPKCPLPYKNMGVLVLRTGTEADAAPWFEKAAALGFKGNWSDSIVMASQRRNASTSTPR